MECPPIPINVQNVHFDITSPPSDDLLPSPLSDEARPQKRRLIRLMASTSKKTTLVGPVRRSLP
jgi:hypothetical protein